MAVQGNSCVAKHNTQTLNAKFHLPVAGGGGGSRDFDMSVPFFRHLCQRTHGQRNDSILINWSPWPASMSELPHFHILII